MLEQPALHTQCRFTVTHVTEILTPVPILMFMAKGLEVLKSCSWLSSGMVTGFETNQECLLKHSVGKAKEEVEQKGIPANARLAMVKCNQEESYKT